MDRRESTLRQQIDHLNKMLEISRVINSTLDLRPLLRMVVHSATQLTACEDSSILLVDPQSGELRFETSAGLKEAEIQPLIVPMDASISGWIVRHNEPLIIPDVHSDPRFFQRVDQATGFPTRSLLGVPMSIKGRVIGVLEVVNKLDGAFTEQDVERLTILAAQASVAIENTRLLVELQRANQELCELDRLKSEFITTTSHELRTPLTAIKGYMHLITGGMVPPEGQAQVLQKVSHHVDTIVRLVNDLLLMQEMEAIDLEFSEVDLARLVREELENTLALAQSAGIEWVPQIVENLAPVQGDVEHLRRMLHNLLDNAIKFSPDGGEVTVRLYAQGEMLCLHISDPGVGIPLQEQSKIFERFYRIERSGDHLFGGLGLGLSIAKHIVEAHGGRIGVISAPGQGSTFTVTLPLKPPRP